MTSSYRLISRRRQVLLKRQEVRYPVNTGRPRQVPGDTSRVLRRCLSLDLEVGVRDHRIRALAAVRGDTDQSLMFTASRGSLASALARLDGLAEGADFLLGHNLIAFDLPHLQAANPGLKLLRLPVVDTLRLNPLAFPRNPYHHLVKDYQDGQLKRGRINDPEFGCKTYTGGLRQPARGPVGSIFRPDDRVALADHRGRRHRIRQGLCAAAAIGKANRRPGV